MRRAHVREEVMQIRAGFQHQRPAKVAVDRMLDDHIEDTHAVVEKNLEFLFGAFRGMLAREDCTMRARGFRRQTVAGGRRQNFFAARAQNRHVLHQALSAHPKMLGDFASGNRPAAGAKPRNNLSPPATRAISGAWSQLFRR
jgi:hypothetical protein